MKKNKKTQSKNIKDCKNCKDLEKSNDKMNCKSNNIGFSNEKSFELDHNDEHSFDLR